MPASEDDHALMERLGCGDDTALNEIVRKWKHPVIRFSYRYLGNEADAEEVAAETFVKVYHACDKFRGDRGKFSTWLFAIAANQAKMRLRWRKRHPELLEADLGEAGSLHGLPSADDPRDNVQILQLREALDKAIRLLPHRLRTAFVLYEIEQMSYRDIAATLDCSEKAVERRLSRARRKLQQNLGTEHRAIIQPTETS